MASHVAVDLRQRWFRCDVLEGRIRETTGNNDISQVLKNLTGSVSEVYAACGFDLTDHDPDALLMLAAIEARLEDLLAVIAPLILVILDS